MSESIPNPLTPQDYAALQRIKELVRQTLPICDKAGSCGVNVEGQRQTLVLMGDFANAVEREFFPHGAQ